MTAKIFQTKINKILLDKKKLLHKWLHNPKLSCGQETRIWSLVYVEGYGMFCVVFQMHDSAQQQSSAQKF